MNQDAPIRIFLAEDSDADYQLIQNTLKQTALIYDLCRVKNGWELMDCLVNRRLTDDRRHHSRPDVILLDLKMPEKSGDEAFLEIMNNPELKHVPVIFLTSLVDQETAIDLMKGGAVDYLNKNKLTAEVLGRSIRYAVELRRKEDSRLKAEGVAIRLGRVLDNASNEIYTFSMETHKIIQANRGARRHLGYTVEEMLQLRPLSFMPDMSEEQFSEVLRPLLTGEQTEVALETIQQRKNGSRYPVEVHLQISRAETPPVFIAIVQDLSERKTVQAKLEHAYLYDQLTGLPNRSLLKERINHTIAQSSRSSLTPVVICVDIDRFKAVMETLGIAFCENVLKHVADRLRDCVRNGDTVARMDGDEFILLMPGSGHFPDITKIVNRILSTMARPFHVDGQELHLTVSIGVAVYPDDGKDAEVLMKNVATAMYRAKEHSRNNYQMFNPSMNARAFGRMAMENSLRYALERNEFLLVYQPEVELRTGRVVESEALIRWKHPEMGLVYPNDFIPLAEESGLVIPMGEWVLRNACTQCKTWQANGLRNAAVSVNISGYQVVQKEFVGLVERILKDSQLDPQCLVLELTESILMENLESTTLTLANLRKIGVGIAIDDFGTGFSSLGYLKDFSISELKIGQTFMRNIIKDSGYASIVRSIIELAHNLRLQVVAEGVETEDQLGFLRKNQCDRVQGLFISAPITADELFRFISNRESIQLKKAS